MVNNQNFSKESLIFAFLDLAEIFGMNQTEFYHSAYNFCNLRYLKPNRKP